MSKRSDAGNRLVSLAVLLSLAVPFAGANAEQSGACGIIPQGYDQYGQDWFHGGPGWRQWWDYHEFPNWDNLHPNDVIDLIINHTGAPHAPNCGA